MTTTPQPLILAFVLATDTETTPIEDRIVFRYEVYYWPNFVKGQIINLTVSDGKEITQQRYYRVISQRFLIGVIRSESPQVRTDLVVYVKEVEEKKADEGGPETEVI